MNIAILGAGAVGGWLAARLAEAGGTVMALTSRAALDEIAIREKGESARVALARFGGPADVLAIAVKAPTLAEAAKSAGKLIGPETLIVPMLNGVPWWFLAGRQLRSVDPYGAIAAALPLAQVIGSVVHASCRRAGPGEVEVVHAEKLILGEPEGGSSQRVERLCALFESAGIACQESADVRRAIWYKLWGNATINPLSALTRATADRLLGDPAIRSLMGEAMDELAAVGAAIGCPINESAEDRMAVTARLGAFKSSMLQDVEAGRPMEVNALLAAPIEIAEAAGVATPTLQGIYALTAELQRSLALSPSSG